LTPHHVCSFIFLDPDYLLPFCPGFLLPPPPTLDERLLLALFFCRTHPCFSGPWEFLSVHDPFPLLRPPSPFRREGRREFFSFFCPLGTLTQGPPCLHPRPDVSNPPCPLTVVSTFFFLPTDLATALRSWFLNKESWCQIFGFRLMRHCFLDLWFARRHLPVGLSRFWFGLCLLTVVLRPGT